MQVGNQGNANAGKAPGANKPPPSQSGNFNKAATNAAQKGGGNANAKPAAQGNAPNGPQNLASRGSYNAAVNQARNKTQYDASMRDNTTNQPKHLSVFQGHDGAPDEDDNGALIAGAAILQDASSKPGSTISQTGLIYGDTQEFFRNQMLNGGKTVDAERSRKNYNWFKQQGKTAAKNLGYRDNNIFDTTPQKSNFSGNFDQATTGGRALATDIANSIADRDQNGKAVAGRSTVYLAGGGQNAAAEAIQILKNDGFTNEQIKDNFTVVQHSSWNYNNANRDKAKTITQPYTMFISDQNRTLQQIQNISGNNPIANAWNEAVDPNVTAGNPNLPTGKRDVSDAGLALYVTDYAGQRNFKQDFANDGLRNRVNFNAIPNLAFNPTDQATNNAGIINFLRRDPNGRDVGKDVTNLVQGKANFINSRK